jgi:hypothetical protein
MRKLKQAIYSILVEQLTSAFFELDVKEIAAESRKTRLTFEAMLARKDEEIVMLSADLNKQMALNDRWREGINRWEKYNRYLMRIIKEAGIVLPIVSDGELTAYWGEKPEGTS